jgi:Tfp pilus assembly protein PilV
MKQRPHPSTESGFTLAEVMIGSIILAFALVSVLAVSTQGFRYIADMRRTARSSQVLQQRIEDLRLINVWTNLTALNNTTFIDTNLPGTTFYGTLTVAPYSPYNAYNGTAIVVCVTATVTWTNQTYHVQTNSLTTLFCQSGLNSYIY